MADRDNPLRPRFPHVRRYPPHPAGAGQRPAKRHPADRLGGDVHLHRLPDHRHPAGGAARLRARRPRLRLGAGRPGDQPAVPRHPARPTLRRARHRRPRAEARSALRHGRQRRERAVHAALGGDPGLAGAEPGQPAGRPPGTRRGGKPGRLGGDRLGHRPGRRAAHRQGDFLERHRQLRRHRPRGAARGAAGALAGAVEHGRVHRPARGARLRPGLAEVAGAAGARRATAVPPCARPGHPARYGPGAGGDRLRHHRHLHHPLLRQPWLGQRSALPECLRRLLHRRPAVVRQ